MTMRILDLFCGLGGASRGYANAGLIISGGVDKKPQPDYPYQFVQSDVFEFIARYERFIRANVDLVHASPPCQAYLTIVKNNGHAGNLERHYENTKAALERLGLPYVIENPAARADVVMCGAAMGLSVIRHRRFELGGWSMTQPPHPRHEGRVRGWRHGKYRDGVWPDGRVMVECYGSGGGKATLAEARHAMGIDWSDDRAQVIEAIPPAYTEAIGRAFLATRIEP
jgi:DNA (cytosine-5)-methyltransferase 1